MLKKPSRIQLTSFKRFLLPLLFFSIILQTGKHFWPDVSFVSGIRVDYLSPTVYVSDIIICSMFLVVIFQKEERKAFLSFLKSKLFLLFLVSVSFSSIFAKSPLLAFWGVLKLLEFSFVVFFVSKNFHKSKNKHILVAITVGVWISSIIAFWQFFLQHSIGSFFYFLGERIFDTSTIGIALLRYNSTLLLRPYATFPHPNVLAFYLFFSLLLLWGWFYKSKNNIVLLATILLASSALFFTFSRVILLLYIIFLAVFFYSTFKVRYKEYIAAGIGLFIILFISFFWTRFFALTFLFEDWTYRADLNKIAWDLFLKFPSLGVGPNNFYLYELSFQKTVSPTLLQPVHNVYLLLLSQIGILGTSVVFLFFFRIAKDLLNKRKTLNSKFDLPLLFLFFSCFFIGMFDHFLLTLQQGQLILSIILGMILSKENQ